MTDESSDHYQKAVTALEAADKNMRNQGVEEERRVAQSQFLATYALTQAVLALVQDMRGRG